MGGLPHTSSDSLSVSRERREHYVANSRESLLYADSQYLTIVHHTPDLFSGSPDSLLIPETEPGGLRFNTPNIALLPARPSIVSSSRGNLKRKGYAIFLTLASSGWTPLGRGSDGRFGLRRFRAKLTHNRVELTALSLTSLPSAYVLSLSPFRLVSSRCRSSEGRNNRNVRAQASQ